MHKAVALHKQARQRQGWKRDAAKFTFLPVPGFTFVHVKQAFGDQLCATGCCAGSSTAHTYLKRQPSVTSSVFRFDKAMFAFNDTLARHRISLTDLTTLFASAVAPNTVVIDEGWLLSQLTLSIKEAICCYSSPPQPTCWHKQLKCQFFINTLPGYF